jgi:hypothetical protein
MGGLGRAVEDDILVLDNIRQHGLIPHVSPDEADPGPDILKVPDSGTEMRVQGVQDRDPDIFFGQAAVNKISADKSGAAYDQYVHDKTSRV